MSYPPPAAPSVLIKTKEGYKLWLFLCQQLPKSARYTLGGKIDSLFLETLEYIFVSLYLLPEQKLIMLSRSISKLDTLKFFCQVAWENKYIANNHYSSLSAILDEVGRMLGGWKKGIEAKIKTPAK